MTGTAADNASDGALISLHELVISRGGRALAQPLSLRFGAGEIWQIAGPNGAGKTSLMRILAGLLPPLSGQLSRHDDGPPQPIRGFDADWLSRLGWLPVSPSFKPQLTPLAVLTAAANLDGRRRPAEEHIAALDDWGLRKLAELPVRHLSAGQRRRLDLARLTRRGAAIWLLDEPTVTLDTGGRDRLFEAIDRHRRAGGLVILASHEALPLDDIRRCALEPA